MRKITVKGTEYPCRMTMGAMYRFKQMTGHEVSRIEKEDISDAIVLVYCCTASACHADGVKFELDFESFADSLSPEELERLMQGMQESIGTADPKKKTQKPRE